MGDLLRRRMMLGAMEESHNWMPLSGNAYISWARQNGSISGDVITFSPTSLGWNYTLTANNLLYKWGNVKDKVIRFSCDYTLTGLVSGGYASISAYTSQIQNPTGTTGRQAYGELKNIASNGSGRVEYMSIFTPRSGTPTDNYYFGLRIYAHTGANSRLTLSNIVYEVDDKG